MKITKITNRRELAIRLDNGVDINLISVRLQRTVNMWLSRNEVKIENGILKMA